MATRFEIDCGVQWIFLHGIRVGHETGNIGEG